jgi:glycosyltransferase involved in cell wall biosynthesis
VVPAYNEEDNIGQLHQELCEALSKLCYPYEVVYVDDGSLDSTFARLEAIFRDDDHVRVIGHRRNFGQTEALLTGIKNAKGDVIVTIDADLQHDPADIGRLLGRILEGPDVVIGWRMHRRESFLTRTVPSRLANFLGRKLLGVDIHDFGCGLKAYRAECVRDVVVEGEGHLFLPAAVAARGYKVVEVKISDRARGSGSSKFGLNMMRRQLLDLLFFWFIVRYWRRPLHFFGSIGGGLVLLGLLAGLVQILRFVFLSPTTLMTPLLLMAAFLTLIGIQFISLGILFEVQMRPHQRVFEIKPAIILSRDNQIPR